MKKIFVALSMVAFLAACDNSSSASAGSNDEPGMESSSSVELGSSSSEKARSQSSSSEKSGKFSSSANDVSLSSEKLSETSSSSAGKTKSSSSERDVPKSYAEAKVMPSGTYDCTKYKCVTTEYLNQEFLETDKYGEILDERDNQVYKTVQIGERIWMAENLNYQTENSWCGGGNHGTAIEGDCSVYGRLYTWAAAVGKSEDECGYDHYCGLYTDNVQGVCPDGWHVPTRNEWKDLFAAVGGEYIAGRKLKATTLWEAKEGFTNEENAYGFAALPAGGRYYNSKFNDVGYCAYFWSASQYVSYYDDVYYVYLCNGDDHAYLGVTDKNYGFSVRCVKD